MSVPHELSTIIDDLVAPKAAEIDRTGVFPREAIDALQAAGILSLTVPTEYGGAGLGLGAASEVVRRLARACSSTAMVATMHYAAVALLNAVDRRDVLTEVGSRRHLTTLAFSETGSRSHFWAPVGTATADGADVVLDAKKSWVTSSHEADSYVWTSKALATGGPMTLWLVPSGLPGLEVLRQFDGLGLRGNDSCPVTATGVRVTSADMLGADGGGLDLALGAVLPCFLVLNAAAGVGLMQSVTAETAAHLGTTHLKHLDQSLAQQLPARTKLAEMKIRTERTRALVADTVAAIEASRDDAQLLVLQVKAAADEAAAEVTDRAMKACGGAAFRKELNIERRFRDSLAARVMAPTTDALLDFVGRALCGLPLLEGPA